MAFYEEGNIEMGRKKILMQYFRTYFLIDFLNLVGLLIHFFDNSNYYILFFALLKIFKFNSYKIEILEYF